MIVLLALTSWIISVTLLSSIFFWGIKQKRPALISAVVILMIQTSIRPIILAFGLDYPMPQTHFRPFEWELMAQANLIIIFWTVILLLVYILTNPMAPLFTWLVPQLRRSPKLSSVIFVSQAPFLFATLGTIYLIIQFGGVNGFVYASKVSKDLQGLFIFKDASTLAAMVAYFGLLSSLKLTEDNKRKLTGISYLFLVQIFISLIMIYTWGVRYNIAILLLSFMLGWHLYYAKLSVVKVLTLSIIALAALQSLRILRTALLSSVVGTDISAGFEFWREISASLHFVQYDSFMLALRDAGQVFSFRNGADFINGLLSWVPRSILPEKETFNVGGWFRQVYQPNIVNGWPITTIGSWYVNLGFWGIIFGAVISGYIVSIFDRAIKHINNKAWAASIGCALCFVTIESGINTGFPQKIVLYIVPLMLAAMFLRIGSANIPNKTSLQTAT